MAARLPERLLALTTGEASGAREVSELLARIGQAFEAGLPAVLLREPRLADGDLLNLASSVLEMASRHDSPPWVGVHDRVHVAQAAGVQGVHLGFRSLTPRLVREIVGNEMAIGVSAHEGDDPKAWEPANYIHYGPLNETPSKRGLLQPVGIDKLRGAVELSSCPVFALGGITPQDVPAVRGCGAVGVSVLSGILGARDVEAATRDYLASWTKAPEARA